MTLARELAEKGETQTVVAYFDLCRAFWKMQNGRLDDWTALVKQGRIPNFGGNLRY